MTDNNVRVVRPPNKIKQKIGSFVDTRDLLKPENVAKAQNLIDSKKEDFLVHMQEDIALLSQTLQKMRISGFESKHIQDIVNSAENLRDRGGTFGYQLISKIAKSLVNYCSEIRTTETHHAVVISKHIEGLSTVFTTKTSGEGGIIGVELMSGLQKLTEKYRV